MDMATPNINDAGLYAVADHIMMRKSAFKFCFRPDFFLKVDSNYC